MSSFLLDADAFLAMRSLSILELLCQSPALQSEPLFMTSFVAHHELSSLAPLVQQLESQGLLRIESARGGPIDDSFSNSTDILV